MSANTEHRSSHPETNAARPIPSNDRPSLQSLLATLAALDFEYMSDIETIRTSSVDEWVKQSTIRNLNERYQERRAPYLRHRTALQKQSQAMAA